METPSEHTHHPVFTFIHAVPARLFTNTQQCRETAHSSLKEEEEEEEGLAGAAAQRPHGHEATKRPLQIKTFGSFISGCFLRSLLLLCLHSSHTDLHWL